MECNESRNLMSVYLDGELDASTEAMFLAHQSSCEKCQAEYNELVKLKTTVKQHANVFSAPAFLHHQIADMIHAEKKPKAPLPKKRRPFSWMWINLGVASASSFAFAMTLFLYLGVPTEAERIDQEIVASHYRSLLANHLSDVASSDHHTVKPWFTGKLNYSPPVYDFAGQGYALQGGRLDYIHQQTVAALVYRHNKHLINLFVWPASSRKDSSVKVESIQGFLLMRWNKDGMAYSAISDMNSVELEQFHQLLAGSGLGGL